MRPARRWGCWFLAEAHGHDGHFAFGALVHQMDVHVGELAFDGLLAGMVEVELDEVIANAADNDVAARVDMDHDGVAVVLKRDRAGDVVELDRLQSLVQVRAAYVDGRLLVSVRAGLIRRVEFAPVERRRACLRSPRGRWCARLLAPQPGGNAEKTTASAGKRIDCSSRKRTLGEPERILSHRVAG